MPRLVTSKLSLLHNDKLSTDLLETSGCVSYPSPSSKFMLVLLDTRNSAYVCNLPQGIEVDLSERIVCAIPSHESVLVSGVPEVLEPVLPHLDSKRVSNFHNTGLKKKMADFIVLKSDPRKLKIDSSLADSSSCFCYAAAIELYPLVLSLIALK